MSMSSNVRRHQWNTEGPFPDDTPVTVRYDPTGRAGDDRDRWPLLAGTVVGRVGEDEWDVAVDDPRAIRNVNGETITPYVYRNGSELTAITHREWSELMDHGAAQARHQKTNNHTASSAGDLDGPPSVQNPQVGPGPLL
jgi:hypothetical protein